MKTILTLATALLSLIYMYSAMADSDCYSDDIHCVKYELDQTDSFKGKFIKMKSAGEFSFARTDILCVNKTTYVYIPQDFGGFSSYEAGKKMTWEFSQCFDQECTFAIPLFKDEFVITKQEDELRPFYSSINKGSLVFLKSEFGENCDTKRLATLSKLGPSGLGFYVAEKNELK